MATGQLATVNPLCPPGYRHLLTMREAKSLEEATDEIVETFASGSRWKLSTFLASTAQTEPEPPLFALPGR
jgi:hypothetical protein